MATDKAPIAIEQIEKLNKAMQEITNAIVSFSESIAEALGISQSDYECYSYADDEEEKHERRMG